MRIKDIDMEKCIKATEQTCARCGKKFKAGQLNIGEYVGGVYLGTKIVDGKYIEKWLCFECGGGIEK